jgi:hypothetical protein
MNIDWINTAPKTVAYDYRRVPEDRDTIEFFTEQFEREFEVSDGDDIGGLIVYSDSCVYDYENFCGWVK